MKVVIMSKISQKNRPSGRHATSSSSATRLFLAVLGIAVLAVLAAPLVGGTLQAASAVQESYPGPTESSQESQESNDGVNAADAESYPAPAQAAPPAAAVEPTAYPEPVEPTTGPAAPASETGGQEPAIATPVPMPQAPDSPAGSQTSLLLVGLVLLGLVIVVVLIVARRR